MFLLMLAAALPGLFWEQGPETAEALKKSGIECVQVAPSKAESWKRAGFCATAGETRTCRVLAVCSDFERRLLISSCGEPMAVPAMSRCAQGVSCTNRLRKWAAVIEPVSQ